MFEETSENSNDSLLDGLVISNRYEVIRCLGSGAMGSVHLARDRLLSGNVVALKVLKRAIADDQNVRQRFLQEVKLMHRVNHANVVRTYDVGVDHDLIYFTMEYVTGISLEKLVQPGGIDLELFFDISLQLCTGLGHIHAADIIHRDLKPANVMLTDGKVKITDFGVARSSRSELTQHKEIIGSTPYIAPEIWMGGKLTPAADFYSLGAIFFELLIGYPPFEHDIPATIMWMHMKKMPEEPKSLRPEIPEWLNALILRMLAKSPENRPSSAEEIFNYIQKRYKTNKGAASEATSEINRYHFCNIEKTIVANLASNLDEECANATSKHSDLFLVASATKPYDNNSHASLAIKGYVANAFSSDGKLTAESLRTGLLSANEVLLSKRRENPEIASIRASIAALAITPDEIFLSFAGNCGVFIDSPAGFKKLTEPFKESASWTLGTTLPLTTDTHKIQYNPGKSMRILLTTPGLVDCLGHREIETGLKHENLKECLNTIISEATKRKSHFSSALLLVEVKNNVPHYVQTPDCQVALSIYTYDFKSRATKSIDSKAFFNQDELDITHKPLIFEEVESTKNQIFEEPKESILFTSLPSTDKIIKQQESLTRESKQRNKKINNRLKTQEFEQLRHIENRRNKIIGLVIIFFVVIGLTLAVIIKIAKEHNLSFKKLTQPSVHASDKNLSAAARYDAKRNEYEFKLAMLNVQLKAAESPSSAKNSLQEAQKEFHALTETIKTLSSNIIAERSKQNQVGQKIESENILKMLLLLEEAKFNREVKQIEITAWRRAVNKDLNIKTSEIKLQLDKVRSQLKQMDSKYSHQDMLRYRIQP